MVCTLPHSKICMWTDYITNWESGGGEKFHLANDASVCPTCPRSPAHATRCSRERVRETFSPARLSAVRRFSSSARAVREKGPAGRSGGRSAPCTSASSVLPTTADQLAYLPTRLPIFRIADTHLHTAAAAAAGLACPAGETSTCLGSDHQ